MRNFLCWCLIIIGLILALYIPIVWMLAGGVIQICNGVKSVPVDEVAVIIGIIKILFCEVGTIPGLLISSLGVSFLE